MRQNRLLSAILMLGVFVVIIGVPIIQYTLDQMERSRIQVPREDQRERIGFYVEGGDYYTPGYGGCEVVAGKEVTWLGDRIVLTRYHCPSLDIPPKWVGNDAMRRVAQHLGIRGVSIIGKDSTGFPRIQWEAKYIGVGKWEVTDPSSQKWIVSESGGDVTPK